MQSTTSDEPVPGQFDDASEDDEKMKTSCSDTKQQHSKPTAKEKDKYFEEDGSHDDDDQDDDDDDDLDSFDDEIEGEKSERGPNAQAASVKSGGKKTAFQVN